MDPVEQVLAQSRVGSSNGATLGLDALKWGMDRRDKLKQQSVSNSLAQDQLDLQKSNSEIYQQQASLAMRVNRMRLEQMQSLNEAGGELADLELSMSSDPNGFLGGSGFDQAKAIFQKHPDIWGTDAGQGFINRMHTAIEGQRRLKQIEDARNSLIGSGMIQEKQTITTPGVGTETFGLKPPNISDIATLAKDRGLESSRMTSTGIETFERPRIGMETVTEVGPDGTMRMIQRPAGKGSPEGLTTAGQTKIQEDVREAQTALPTLNDAVTAIRNNPRAIGPMGVILEGLEKIKGILHPDMPMSTPITDTRHKAGLALVALSTSLRVDTGNMSKYELEQMQELGDVRVLEEAPQTALTKLYNLKNAVIGKQIRGLHALKQPLPDNLLKQIPRLEISKMVASGLVTPEESLKWYDLQK